MAIPYYFANLKFNDGPQVDPKDTLYDDSTEWMLGMLPQSRNWNLTGARVDVDDQGVAGITLADGTVHNLDFFLDNKLFIFQYQDMACYLYSNNGKFCLKVNARALWCDSLKSKSNVGRYVARWLWFIKTISKDTLED